MTPLLSGNRGLAQTLRKLNQLATSYGRNVAIRLEAESIIRGKVVDNDVSGQVYAVLNYVKDKVRYLRDPLAWEYVKTPDLMLEQIRTYGHTMGDCDDHVLLMNTLLDSLGIRTKCVAVIINGASTFNHVISSVYMRNRWVDLDPCAKRSPQPFFGKRFEV